MAEKRNVLLARPHPMIVRHMKPFLENLGFQGRPVQNLQGLKGTGSVSGIVISTSISSTVDEDPAQALDLIREKYPHAPIMVATLIPDLKHVQQAFKRSRAAEPMQFVEAARHSGPTGANTVIVVHKDELEANAASLQQLVNRHFAR